MDKLFGNQKVPLECLKCGDKFQESISRLQEHAQFRHVCSKCGEASVFDTRQFKTQMAGANKAVDKLRKTIKKFGK